MRFHGLRLALPGGLLFLLLSPALAEPLHDAARDGDVAAARRLILQGANVNAEDQYGFKPLYLARQRGHSNIIGMLRHAGGREDFSPTALRRAQTYLAQLGHYDGPIDGVMGDGTEQAIRNYQRSREDLAVTGEVGEDWVVTLYADLIRETQIRLKSLGLYDDDIDGVLGPGTLRAINAFQERAELSETTELSPDWLDPLWTMAETGEIDAADTTAASDSPEADSDQTDEPVETVTAEARVGTDSASVRQIQQRLAALGYALSEVNGELDPATRVAIREFQENQNLPITGEVSPDWVLKLDALIIDQARQRLIDLGFKPEQVRLETGPQTQEAIREFQTEMGMEVTGVVGEDWADQLREIAEARAAAEAEARATRERNTLVQSRLATLGFDPGGQDGELNAGTLAALNAFQSDYGLPATQEIDDEVVASLEAALWRRVQTRLSILNLGELETTGEADEASLVALAKFREAQDLPAADTLDQELLTALDRETGRYIQERLKILGFDPGTVDGQWDEAAVAAARGFQESQGLSENPDIAPGWVDALDQEALRQVQKRLQMLGLNPGNTDGLMTDDTREAIHDFQRQAELPVSDALSADWVIALDLAILKSVQSRLQSLGVDTEAPAAEAPEESQDPPPGDDTSALPPSPDAETPVENADADDQTVTEPSATLAEIEEADTQTEESLAQAPDPDTIRAVQARLQLLGFDTGAVDGIDGPSTREAIRAFESARQLPATGEISETLISQMNEERLHQTQKLLKSLGHYQGEVDGLMGPATREAMTDFQRSQNLTVDGDPSDTLLSALQQAEIQRAEQAAANTQLREVQSQLKLLGYNVGPVDGELGPSTRRAITRFQRRNRLAATGEISESLLGALNSGLTRLAQRHLRTLNYNVGPVDGELGATTRRAIRRFQQQARLSVNGEVSEQLIRSLAGAVATQEAATAARRAAEQEEARREAEALARREAERREAERREAERRQAEAVAATGGVSPEVLGSIQTNLRALNLYDGEVDNTLGPSTRQAIRRFQQQAGLSATGEPSNELASRLSQTVVNSDGVAAAEPDTAPVTAQNTPDTPPDAAQNAPEQAPASPPEPIAQSEPRAPAEATPSTDTPAAVTTVAMTTPAPPPPPPPLSSSQISQLQADLGALGHNPGPVDGTMGQRTEQALRAFQRDAGLPVTGQADTQQLALLGEQAAEARSQSLRQNGTRTASGNTEITGKMTFQRSNGGDLIGCSVGNIQLDMAWCSTFASRRDLDDCRVILRPNAQVLVVNCV